MVEDSYSGEAMTGPAHMRSKDIAWQVESTLANELLADFGWQRYENRIVNDNGELIGIRDITWKKIGTNQLVSEYGANKIYIHLKAFLSKELPLTRWSEEIIKNTILNHIQSLTIDLAIDPKMGVRDGDLDTLVELLKTVFRSQAYKANGGYFMDKLGEEKRILVTEQRSKDKPGFWSNMPFRGGGDKDEIG